VERLNRDVLAVLATPEIRTRFAELGGTPGDLSPADYTGFISREVANWAPLVQAAGATAD
jgi:tripartite-type tricarboxylate transporter receptor subunit TctC